MTAAIEKAAALAAAARAKQAKERWRITRPGQEPFTVVLNPPQTQEWVLNHYQGCGVLPDE
jgi:hypothetical protein